MCLIAIAIEQSEEYPLILLSNRDEFLNRPTNKMHWWKDKDILAGQDLKAGGTWLGINHQKQFAIITNYRDPKHQNPLAPSRGIIPVELLEAHGADFNSYVQAHQQLWNQMNGFNLVYGDSFQVFHYSNVSQKINVLKKGIYGISNALLDTPWPKVEALKEKLSKSIAQKDLAQEKLVELLFSTKKYPDAMLPNTGVGHVMEKILSPICIKTPLYGTRAHTIILKDISGKMFILEKQADTHASVSFEID